MEDWLREARVALSYRWMAVEDVDGTGIAKLL